LTREEREVYLINRCIRFFEDHGMMATDEVIELFMAWSKDWCQGDAFKGTQERVVYMLLARLCAKFEIGKSSTKPAKLADREAVSMFLKELKITADSGRELDVDTIWAVVHKVDKEMPWDEFKEKKESKKANTMATKKSKNDSSSSS
jgi:hypothetical protein